MILNKIPASFGKDRSITLEPINYQYDAKQFLVISGLDLPEYYEVDFCNEDDEQTITMSGDSAGVEIPDDFLLDGRNIKAYLVLTGEDEEAVETRYEITIPVKCRPTRIDIDPTPAEQQQIDNLIAQMNDAVERSETAASESETSADESHSHAQDSEAWAIGKRDGVDVEDTDETYQNNSKHWAGYSEQIGQEKATLAESWAVGGTGTRQDEDNDNAKHYAELAAQGAEESGYAWFDIHDNDGHMYVYISDNLSEDVSFAINELTGHLEVTYS